MREDYGDTFSRLYLARIFEVMETDGPAIRQKTLKTVARWAEVGSSAQSRIDNWRELLSLDLSEQRDTVMADTEAGRELRHAHPFAAILPLRETTELRLKAKAMRLAASAQ